jgi:hypothetical protein
MMLVAHGRDEQRPLPGRVVLSKCSGTPIRFTAFRGCPFTCRKYVQKIAVIWFTGESQLFELETVAAP